MIKRKPPDFDPKPLEDIDLDPFEIGWIAPKGAVNPYQPGTLGHQAFKRGQRYKRRRTCPLSWELCGDQS